MSQPLRVLIVDDEERLRRALVRLLGDHETVEAADGAAARRILERDQAFDVILCDMMMPGVSGMDLHGWLREAHPRLAGRLIFITGGAFTPRAKEFIDSVPNLCLEKPFLPERVCEAVAGLLKRVRQPPTAE